MKDVTVPLSTPPVENEAIYNEFLLRLVKPKERWAVWALYIEQLSALKLRIWHIIAYEHFAVTRYENGVGTGHWAPASLLCLLVKEMSAVINSGETYSFTEAKKGFPLLNWIGWHIDHMPLR